MCLPAAIRVAYSKAKIGFVFSRRGIIMEAVSSFFLPKLIGTSRALHLTTTGAVYPAEHPLFGTLFSETLPSPEATLQRALELANEVAANTSTISTKLMRDLMYRAPGTAEEAHLLDSRVIYGLFGGPDNTEARSRLPSSSCIILTIAGRQVVLREAPAEFHGTIPSGCAVGMAVVAADRHQRTGEGWTYLQAVENNFMTVSKICQG